MPLVSRDQLIKVVWQLVEELYLESATHQAAGAYTASNEAEKRTILNDFAKQQALKSNRWAHILRNLLSADLNG
jgi:hypothetical protein